MIPASPLSSRLRLIILRTFCHGSSGNSAIVMKPVSNIYQLLAQSAHLFKRTCVLPHFSTDGVARIFSLTHMPRTGIKLMSVQLHLFQKPKLRTLDRLSYRGCGICWNVRELYLTFKSGLSSATWNFFCICGKIFLSGNLDSANSRSPARSSSGKGRIQNYYQCIGIFMAVLQSCSLCNGLQRMCIWIELLPLPLLLCFNVFYNLFVLESLGIGAVVLDWHFKHFLNIVFKYLYLRCNTVCYSVSITDWQ